MTLGVPPSPPFIQVVAFHPNQPQDPDFHPSCSSSRILLKSSIIAAKRKKSKSRFFIPNWGGTERVIALDLGKDEEAEDKASLRSRAWDKS